MPKCAFLSIADTAGWFIDDDLVHEPLRKIGWEIQNIPWDQATDWNEFDMVVIRSPWDYQDNLAAFLKVLDQIDQSNAILRNSLEMVKWNINKNYLFELEGQGIELVPTIKKERLLKTDLENAFASFQTEEVVVKPMIGANADDTFRIRKEHTERMEVVETVFQNRACMIQPFMKNIVAEGEFSVMYFEGQLSHVILKTVKAGDYRVQEEHGGGVTPVPNPEKGMITAANKAMLALPEIPLYARVDLVRTAKGSFALMELELIEPCLYFRFGATSSEHFAKCMDDSWKNEQRSTTTNTHN